MPVAKFIDICVKVIGKNLPQIGPNEFFAISFHIVPYSHHFMHSQVVCIEKLCSIPTSYNIFSEKSKANEKEEASDFHTYNFSEPWANKYPTWPNLILLGETKNHSYVFRCAFLDLSMENGLNLESPYKYK